MGPPTPPGGPLQSLSTSPARMIFPKLKSVGVMFLLKPPQRLIIGFSPKHDLQGSVRSEPCPQPQAHFCTTPSLGTSCNGFVSFLDRHHSIPTPTPKAFLHVLPSLVPVTYPLRSLLISGQAWFLWRSHQRPLQQGQISL